MSTGDGGTEFCKVADFTSKFLAFTGGATESSSPAGNGNVRRQVAKASTEPPQAVSRRISKGVRKLLLGDVLVQVKGQNGKRKLDSVENVFASGPPISALTYLAQITSTWGGEGDNVHINFAPAKGVRISILHFIFHKNN